MNRSKLKNLVVTPLDHAITYSASVVIQSKKKGIYSRTVVWNLNQNIWISAEILCGL